MTRTMCDNNVYAGYRFPAGTIANLMLNRGPAGDTIIITDADIEEAIQTKPINTSRYTQCMDIFQKYPLVLQKIMKFSNANIFRLREHIYNIFETRVNIRDLRAMQNSPIELQELIASVYSKKSNYKTKLCKNK